jgi:hypothetical protein
MNIPYEFDFFRSTPKGVGKVCDQSTAGSVSFRWRRLFTVNAYGVFTQIYDVHQKNNSFHWKIKNIRERLRK